MPNNADIHERVEVYTEYQCSKRHKWVKVWRTHPWFGDYTQTCKKCGQPRWPHYKFDNSSAEVLREKRQWWR